MHLLRILAAIMGYWLALSVSVGIAWILLLGSFRASRPSPAPPSTDRLSSRPGLAAPPRSESEFERWLLLLAEQNLRTAERYHHGDMTGTSSMDASAKRAKIALRAIVDGSVERSGGHSR